MFQIGELIAFRPDLILGTKYGTVTYTPTLNEFRDDVLRVVRITTAGTAVCQVYTSARNYPRKEISTIHESMILRPRFDINTQCYISDKYLKFLKNSNNITRQMMEILLGTRVDIVNVEYSRQTGFEYGVKKEIPMSTSFVKNHIPEKELCNVNEYKCDLNDYENENRLQEQESNYFGGEDYEGCRVHGKVLKSKVSSGCLGDSTGVRGS